MASNQRNIITTLSIMALNTMRDNMGTKLDNVDNKSSLPIIIGLAERAPYIVHNLK